MDHYFCHCVELETVCVSIKILRSVYIYIFCIVYTNCVYVYKYIYSVYTNIYILHTYSQYEYTVHLQYTEFFTASEKKVTNVFCCIEVHSQIHQTKQLHPCFHHSCSRPLFSLQSLMKIDVR